MKVTSRQLIYLGLVAGILVLAYMARAVLGPFVLAALFAYLLNPLVNFLTHRIRLSRTISISLIYILLIGILTVAALNIGVRISQESNEFSLETRHFVSEANIAIASLPDWIQPVAHDGLASAQGSLLIPRARLMTFIPSAVNRTISVMIFLVAGFYFLRDGAVFVKSLLGFFPKTVKDEMDIVVGKIGRVLGNYLRGQLLLVFIMSVVTYVALLIVGVRYALILSIFTGFAEVVPFIGPLVAGTIATTVSFVDNYSRIGASPIVDAAAVASLYLVLRQVEDLFIIPQVMGRMTKLHPLVVMLVVLAGGHLFGVVGYLVAVPFAASLKVVLEHLLPLVDSHKSAL